MIGDNEEAFVKRLFGNLVLAAVVVAVFAFFAAPAVAFFAIRSAAEAGDVAGLSRLIDFGAVRQSLRPQLAGRPRPWPRLRPSWRTPSAPFADNGTSRTRCSGNRTSTPI